MSPRYCRQTYPELKTANAALLLAGCSILAGCADSGNGTADIHFRIAEYPQSSQIEIRNIQFYISEIALLTRDGKAVEFLPTFDARWQMRDVALMNLSGNSDDAGHTILHGEMAEPPADGYDGIRFDIGVPFELNHADPLAAVAPLNRMDMFWAWQTGYKFLRVELAQNGRAWAFHLGSTGCSSASAVRPPASECLHPNRITVELTGFDPRVDGVQLQLPALIEAMHAADFAPCVGNFENVPACTAPFALTGLTAAGEPQRLFGPAD